MALLEGFRIEGGDIPAIADGTVAQYTVVKLSTDSSGGDMRVTTCGTSDKPIGIAQNAAADGEQVIVRIMGISKVSANGAYSIGDKLTVAASDGEVDTLAADGEVVGIALHAATAAGDKLPVLLRFYYENIP